MAAKVRPSRPGSSPSGGFNEPHTLNGAPASESTTHSDQDRSVQGDEFTNRLITLHEISLQIDAAQSREAIFEMLRTELKWLLPGEFRMICLLDRSRTQFAISVLNAPGVPPAFDGSLWPLEEGATGQVIQSHIPRVVDLKDESLTPGSVEAILAALGMQTLLLVPLQAGDETIGALGCASRASFSAQDLAVARLVGSQIAVALMKMTVFEEAKRRIVQIELVNELAEHLTATLELNDLLQSATKTIQGTFKFSDVGIFLADRKEHVARLVAHTGISGTLRPMEHTQRLSEGIVGWVATTGERVVANDVTEDARFINPGHLNTRAEMAIPIRVEGEVVGVLNVEDERAHVFDETDATVLETLCDQIGSALHNAQLYDELRRSNAKLTEVDRMKSDFLSIVSHDFRAPLASILLAARSLLKKGEQEPGLPGHQYLNIIIEQSERLITLAEDTLSITRLESGKMNYLFNAVSVERMILDAVAQVHLTSRHTLRFNFERGLGYARGDQAKLRQVVQNLVSNAVKYSPLGGPVEVSARAHSQDQILISVADKGIGIPADQLGRLFQKFTRIDTEDARNIRGTGLGLWICREIVEAHGGEIWAESTRGKGSVFRFTLRKTPIESPVGGTGAASGRSGSSSLAGM